MARILTITFLATILMIVFFASLTFSRDDEDIAVGCYLGSMDQYEQVGTIDVFNPSTNAVGLCNATYWDCNGQCWACWTDSDGEAVCKDLSGRQFNR
ncbi:MAG: hypothetical protein KA801_15435 [Syntrophorhabdaceae bacterium]|nr:hypothetical protein [Syntrophorhabdaceae bacterium]